MADKEEDKTEAREDAVLDKVLTRLDAVMSRMDAMEQAEKDRKDGAEADEKAKADAAAEDEKAKADAAKKDEDGDKPGEPEKVAADKAAKDAEEKEASEKAEKDAAEEEEAAKKDAQDTRARIAGMEKTIETLRAGRPEGDAAKIAAIRERADTVFQAFGDSAPAPWADETDGAYRRRLAAKLQVHSERAKDVKLTAIHDEAGFAIFEDLIYADAQAAARNPVDLPHGKLREVVSQDRHTGIRTTTFVGKGTFIGHMKRPSQRARLVLNQNARG